jgi:hypothetical protein
VRLRVHVAWAKVFCARCFCLAARGVKGEAGKGAVISQTISVTDIVVKGKINNKKPA